MPRAILSPDEIVQHVTDILDPVFHHKLSVSIGHAVLGVMHADRVGVNAIGHAMAQQRCVDPKHAIKQVDRLLSNDNFDMAAGFEALVAFVVGSRDEIVVAFDWTEYGGDGHSRIVLSLVTSHGRATPLVWKTVTTSELKDRRNALEDELLQILADALPEGTDVTVLADRGFGDVKLYEHLRNDFGWHFIIRFRDVIRVTGKAGTPIPARTLVPDGGRAAAYDNLALTAKQVIVPRVVAVHDDRMKEPWLLASTRTDLSAEGTVALYGRRFTIEESFRDEKDRRFGLGLVDANIGAPIRRDRMIFIMAIASIFLTMLGAAGERAGLDKKVRANTVKTKRTHSLFRQGREYLRGAFHRFARLLRRARGGCDPDHVAMLTSARWELA